MFPLHPLSGDDQLGCDELASRYTVRV